MIEPTNPPLQNTTANITPTPTTEYYNNSKLTFHNLTPNKIIPPIACTVRGLGMKFIKTPPYTTTHVSKSLSCFEQDLNLCIFFAHQQDDDFTKSPPKLYSKSIWSPPWTNIPPWVDARLGKISSKIKESPSKHPKCPTIPRIYSGQSTRGQNTPIP
jgi:hypothetical protein